MKIVLNKSGYFELSIRALDELADMINVDIIPPFCDTHAKYYSKYYVSAKINLDYGSTTVTLEKRKRDSDCEYSTVILTKKTFDGESIEMSLDEYNDMEKISMGKIFGRFAYGMRSDKRLVSVVEKLGENAFTKNSYLKIVEIPDDSFWEIINFRDGSEDLVYSESEIKMG